MRTMAKHRPAGRPSAKTMLPVNMTGGVSACVYVHFGS